ncbi:hypothetical protein [Pseudomonas juntendi]|uniref:Uncharacterized protein n=1 Tax=Pseudomonas juntendi TaxID=2666183 RepID=A0A7W2PUU2_9PSED|nr:hypothetical protein [Pseudomonas juntendi]EJG5355149.1 hypothetical protein [Salmonella enterica]EPL59848.1 hypothetical protein B382_23993 [Stutzerimonas stutzeri B1SMN1]MBA6061627.1 hypothetical protein [Pseudomonas juntendi]
MNSETKENLKAIARRNLPVAFIIPGAFITGATAIRHDRLVALADLLGFSFGAYVPIAIALILVGGSLRYVLGGAGLALFGLGCAVFGAMLLTGLPMGWFALGNALLMVGIALAIFSPE